MNATRKHYIVLAGNRADDRAEWVIGWTLQEAQGFRDRLKKQGFDMVTIREVGPIVEEFGI